jgi:hypothetical protein
MTFVILLSHPRAEPDSNGYVEGMGGEPFSLFRIPEVTHSWLFSKLRKDVNTWLEQSNARVRVSFFDFAEWIPFTI